MMSVPGPSKDNATSAPREAIKAYECPVCYSVYDDKQHLAKTLRCGHTACLLCLRRLHSQNSVKCPNCRKQHDLEDIVDLPTNFSLMAALDEVCSGCRILPAFEKHSKRCQNCFKLHVDTSMEVFQEFAEEFRRQIAKLSDKAKDQEIVREVNANADMYCQELSEFFDKYHRELDEKEQEMKIEIRVKAAENIEKILERQGELKEELVDIQKTFDEFDDRLNKGLAKDIAIAGKHIAELKQLSKEIPDIIKNAEKWPHINSPHDEVHECKDLINSIKQCGTPTQYTSCIVCKDDKLKTTVFSLAGWNMWYSYAVVSQVFDNDSIGQEVFNKPHDVAVSPVDGSIVVVNEGKRSLSFFKESDDESSEPEYDTTEYAFDKVVENLGEEGSIFFGVTIDLQGKIYVTDQIKGCIWVFNRYGQQIKKIGSKGAGPLELDYPTGITIDKEPGQLYVCDFNNHRVQVITTNGDFVRTFGWLPNWIMKNHGPWYVAVEEGDSGDVYLEASDNQIYIFNKEGNDLGDFFTDGHAEYGLAIDSSGNLFSAHKHPNALLKCSNHEVIVEMGSLQKVDKRCNFSDVRGIAVTKGDRNVIVCDHKQNNLKVLAMSND